MFKTMIIDGYNVIISDNNITVMFGAWSWSAWMNGRKEQYNSVKPAKPLKQMNAIELKRLAKEAVTAGKNEKAKLTMYFAGLDK